MLKVLVIGSGPVGLAAISALKRMQTDMEITLLDPFLDHEVTPSAGFGDLVKTKFGSSGMYFYPKEFISNETGYPVHLSSTFGGLSTVWGAGLDFNITSLQEVFDPVTIDKSLKLVRQLFPNQEESRVVFSKVKRLLESSDSKSVNLASSNLAVKWSDCIYCGNCLTGCPTNAIWDARDQINNSLTKGIRKHKGFVTSLKCNIDQTISVISVDSKGTYATQVVDKCYVACGPIASASLLQRSKLFPNVVELLETGICYTPCLLPNFKREKDRKKFSASQFFLHNGVENGPERVWVSFFDGSAELRQKSSRYLHGFEKLIPGFVFRQFVFGISYLPPSLSGKIRIEYNGVQSLVSLKDPPSQILAPARDYLKRVRRVIRDSGIFPLQFLSRQGKIGSSFHVGVASNGEEKLLNLYGSPKNCANIHVVDSSALPSLEVGPVTALAMINAAAIVHSTITSQ